MRNHSIIIMQRRLISVTKMPREVVQARLTQALEESIIDIKSMHKDIDRRIFNNERMVSSISQDIEYIDSQLERLHSRVDAIMAHLNKY